MGSWTTNTLLLALAASATHAAASTVKLDFVKGPRSGLTKRAASGYVNSPILEGEGHFSDYYINLTIGTPPQVSPTMLVVFLHQLIDLVACYSHP